MCEVIVLFSCLLLIIGQSYACKSDWDNTCKTDSDCCSTFCDNNNGQWSFGICKPSSTKKVELTTRIECKDDWYDRCTKNSDCCSNNCENKDGKWDFGVCKPRVTTRKQHTTFKMNACKKDWDNTCAKNSDCCSNVCDKHNDGHWDFGVCQPKPKPTKLKPTQFTTLSSTTTTTTSTTTTTTLSKKNIISTTQSNRYPNKLLQACECVCKNEDKISYGICKFNDNLLKIQQVETTTHNTNCKKDWDNTCSKDSECCSNFCETYNGKWKLGVCKQLVKSPS